MLLLPREPSPPPGPATLLGPPGVPGKGAGRTPGQPEGGLVTHKCGRSLGASAAPGAPYMNRVGSALAGLQVSSLAKGPGHL